MGTNNVLRRYASCVECTAMKLLRLSILLAFSAASFGAPPATKPAPLGDQEKHFVKEAAEAQLNAQLLSSMGMRSLTAADPVKKLTAKVNAELLKVWEEFATVGMAKGAQVPTEVGHTDKAAAGKIGKLPADKLDKELIKELAKESKKTARIFDTAGKSLRDPEFKTFVDKWAPALKTQSEELQQLEDTLKKSK